MFTQPAILSKHLTLANAILFEGTGYVDISNELYEDSKVLFTFVKPTKELRLIPKYMSDENQFFISLNEENRMNIGAFVKGAEKSYGAFDVTAFLVETNTIEVLTDSGNFTIKVNGQPVFKLQSALFTKGSVRVVGEAGEIFYSCEVEEPQSVAWETNANESGIQAKQEIINGHNFMKLKGSAVKKATIGENISINTGFYTFSMEAEGQGSVVISKMDGTVMHDNSFLTAGFERINLTFESLVAEEVKVELQTNSELTAGKWQLEEGMGSTAYIKNADLNLPAEREASQLRIPIREEFDKESGSLFMKIRTIGEIPGEQTLVKTDDGLFILHSTAGSVNLTLGQNELIAPANLQAESDYEILVTWDLDRVGISLNGENITAIQEGMGLLSPKEFIFADESMISEEVVIEEFALFNNVIPYDESIFDHLAKAQINALFSGGIAGRNVSWSEIPVAPMDHSPILVQKDNGDTLKKVSFFDTDTGAYRTWNEEIFVYDGVSDFLEVAYNNLDEEFRNIAVRTADGEKIGEPYSIEGKRIHLSLFTPQKVQLKNQELFVTYQVNDSYTIDYNIKAVDGYRIDFAKHDGSQRVVYQEGNRFGESKKLATMIDMNPLQNQNHEGFLYITETVNKTESFRITASPDRLRANGASYSTIVVEPLDHQGNFLSHANIEITAEQGFITRHIQKDAVEAQKRSGQYLYQYISPYYQSKIDGEVMEDTIWVVDKDNNIGVSYKMLLSPITKREVGRVTRTEKNVFELKTKMIEYLLQYEGVEIHEDAELVALLDLNGDGRITMEEVTVLENKQRDGDLKNIIKKMQEWEGKQ